MRGFLFFAMHNGDPVKKELIRKVTAKVDPNPHWANTGDIYPEEDFINFYDWSHVVDSDTAANDSIPRAWGIFAPCSESFTCQIDYWGSPANNEMFKTSLDVTDDELQWLKDNIVWHHVDVYVDGDMSPLFRAALDRGYNMKRNVDNDYRDAKEAELVP